MSQLLKQKSGGGNTGGGGGSKDYSGDTSCRYCKAKDHIVTACPKIAAKDKENKSPGGGGKLKDPKGKSKHWTKVPPKDGDPHTKSNTKDGVCQTYQYCGVCKRWRTGVGSHLTAQHVKKDASKTTPAGHTAKIDDQDQTYPFGMWSGSVEGVTTYPFDIWCAPTDGASTEAGSIEEPSMDDVSFDNPPMPEEDVPIAKEVPMDVEDDDSVHLEPDKHPKGSPGCN